MIKVLIIDENPNHAKIIQNELNLFTNDLIVLNNYELILQYLKQYQPDVIFININFLSRLFSEGINFADFYTIVVADAPEPEYLRLAMLVKADDMIIEPLMREIILTAYTKAKNQVLTKKNIRLKQNLVSKQISFFSNFKEIGQTVLSLHLAYKLAKLNKFRILWTDLEPESLIIKSITEKHQLLGEEFLSIGDIYCHDNLELFKPKKEVFNDEVALFSCLSKLKKNFDYVLVDIPKNFNKTVLVALNLSDTVIFLINLLKDEYGKITEGLSFLNRMNIDKKAINLIVNKYEDFHNTFTKKEIEDKLQKKIQLLMPKDNNYAKIEIWDFNQREMHHFLTQKLDILLDLISI